MLFLILWAFSLFFYNCYYLQLFKKEGRKVFADPSATLVGISFAWAYCSGFSWLHFCKGLSILFCFSLKEIKKLTIWPHWPRTQLQLSSEYVSKSSIEYIKDRRAWNCHKKATASCYFLCCTSSCCFYFMLF